MSIKTKKGTLEELLTFLKESQFTYITQNKYNLYCKKTKTQILSNCESYTTYISNFKKLFGKDSIEISTAEILESKEFRWLSLTPAKKPLDKDGFSSIPYLSIDFNKLFHKDCSLFSDLCLDNNINSFVYTKVGIEYNLTKPYLHLEDNNLNLADREEFSKPYKSIQKGDWSLIKHHLMNLCGEEEVIYNHLLKLYASKLKNPLIKDNDQTIILYDKGGTGKSTWFQILDELNGNISGLVKPEERIYMPNFHKTKFSYMSEIDHLGSPAIIMGRVKVLTEALVIRNRKNIAEESITNFNLVHIATNNLGWLEAETSSRRWILANGGDLKLEVYLASKGIPEDTILEYLNGVNGLKFNTETSQLVRNQISAFVYHLINEVDTTGILKQAKSELFIQTFEAKSSQYENHPFNIFIRNMVNANDIKGITKIWFDSYDKPTISEPVLYKIFQDSIDTDQLIVSDKSIKISNTLLRKLFDLGEPKENYKKTSFSYFNKVCNFDSRKGYKNKEQRTIKGQTFKKQ